MSVLSELREDWQGIPVPVPGETVVLAPRHPLAEKFKAFQTSGDGERGTCGTELPRVVNHWYSHSRARDVFILEAPDGRRHAEVFPVSPGFAMDRLELWIRTLGPSDAWDLEAEHRAQEKLRGLVSDRQWRHFELTGTFLETSPRSRLTYLFRRGRPTLALSPRDIEGDADRMTCIAALCLHPVGYYAGTWSGCMVPSDDLIAHLLAMRADEADFWRQSNHHRPWRPEAGV